MNVSNISEIPAEYGAALDEARLLRDLLAVVKKYAEVAIDAVHATEKMDDNAFVEWRGALRKERRGEFMGEALMERFGAILMPETMLKVSLVADQFKVPWGLAYNRLREVGRLTIKHGVAIVDEGRRR